MKNKNIEIPEDYYAQFIEVLYTAIQHITPTEDNANIMYILKGIVHKAFEDGDVLVENGKIIDRKSIK